MRRALVLPTEQYPKKHELANRACEAMKSREGTLSHDH